MANDELTKYKNQIALLEEKIRQLENATQEREYLTLLDTIDTHIFALNRPDTYGMVNRAHAEFFGLRKEDLINQNLNHILSPHEAAACIAENTRIFTNRKQVVTEEILHRADGAERLFSFTKSPRLSKIGQVEYVVCSGEDITERREAERLLALTKFSIDNVEMAIFWCHADGSFFYVNKTACKWLGYSFDELKTMHVADINPELPREKWEEHWQNIKRHGMLQKESVHQRKSGEVYPVEVYSNYVQFEGKEYKLSFVNDITNRIRTREALRASQHFLENVLESIQDGICVLDKEYTILHTNRVMREWYADSGPLVGQKCHNAYHGSATICKNCPTRRAMRTGSSESDIVPGPLGSGIEWLEIFSFPLKDLVTEEITGVVEFVRDITERVRLERQLAQAQRMQAVGTLSGGISHDFNNLLQTILGSIQLLIQSKNPTHPDQKYLSLIEAAVTRAQKLTSRLLYFSRNVDTHLEPVDLNAELPGLVKLLERSIPKMVHIVQQYQPGLKSIQADLVQIEQIILNLAINASQAMPNGGELTLKTEHVFVDSAHLKNKPDLREGDYVALTVSDTGTGMDEETLGRIFEPFFTTKPTGEGFGLGLSMVYGIVKSHGGTITCYSTPQIGTTFRIYFPALAEEAAVSPQDTVSSTPATGNERILIVDDETALRQVASDILMRFGYTCLQAGSGEEALERLDQDQDSIDLILLDLNMPGMGGYKCLEEIAKLKHQPKVIVTSGYAANDNTLKLLEAGARTFLQKPYQVVELAKTVRKVLDSS